MIQFGSELTIQFDLFLQFDSNTTTAIWITIYDSTDLLRFTLNHTLRSNLIQLFKFYLAQWSDSIWHKIHIFDLPFPIGLSYSDSFWLSIYNLIWPNFLILFDYNYNHSTHHLQLNSSFLIQFESSSPIIFDSSVIIKFDSVIPFDLTQTSHSWINFSDLNYMFWLNLTQNFRFNLAQHFQFNFIGVLDLIRLPLHQFDSPFMIQLIFSDSIQLIISDPIQLIISESIWLSYPIWLEKHCKHLDHCFKFD